MGLSCKATVLQNLFQYAPPKGSQVLPETCSPLGSPRGHSLFQAQVLHTPQVDHTSMDLYELQGTTCINSTLQRLQGNLGSSTPSTFFHSFCSAHSVCEVISLAYSHSCPSAAVVQLFLPLLK